jgi:hypothetical protein
MVTQADLKLMSASDPLASDSWVCASVHNTGHTPHTPRVGNGTQTLHTLLKSSATELSPKTL